MSFKSATNEELIYFFDHHGEINLSGTYDELRDEILDRMSGAKIADFRGMCEAYADLNKKLEAEAAQLRADLAAIRDLSARMLRDRTSPEINQLRADAERYRYLRADYRDSGNSAIPRLASKKWDEIIDAAIAKSAKRITKRSTKSGESRG